MARIEALTKSGSTASARAQGRGPTLLVVHPGGADESSWDAVTRNLISDFEVVRVRRRIYLPGADLAGHSMAVEVADILAIAAVLEPPILLVGHSSGAVAAFEAALSIPWEFAGLIAYEPPMPTRELVGGDALRRAQAAYDAGDVTEAIRIHLRDIVQVPPELVDAILSTAARAETVASVGAQLADDAAIDALGTGIDRYAGLTLPITLVQGELSPAHLRERLADLAAVLPDADIVTLPGQGHVANLMAPDQLADVIRGVARRVLAGPPG
jgi:pimeloyl-ACP methyl ester carboxylesterase